MYLVIRTGYEGIEELNWLTSDPMEAIKKAKLLQMVCVKELVDLAYNPADFEDDDTYLDKLTDEKIQHTKDFVCVQKWTGEKFVCACAELGINPSKRMFR